MAVIVDPFTWTEGEIPSAADWTLRFSTWVNEFNGSIDSDNILSASVIDENFAEGIIGDEKMVSAVSMRPTANWCFKETNFGLVNTAAQMAINEGASGVFKRCNSMGNGGLGISNTTNGKMVLSYRFANGLEQNVLYNDNAAEADSTHRIYTLVGTPIIAPAGKGGFATFLYSPTDTKWILLNGWNFA